MQDQSEWFMRARAEEIAPLLLRRAQIEYGQWCVGKDNRPDEVLLSTLDQLIVSAGEAQKDAPIDLLVQLMLLADHIGPAASALTLAAYLVLAMHLTPDQSARLHAAQRLATARHGRAI